MSDHPPALSTPPSGPLQIDLVATEAPAAVQELLEAAARLGASDLLFCAEDGDYGVLVRHLGVSRRLTQVPQALGQRCVGHIKSLSGMDITDRRRPQDGHWVYSRPSGEVLDLRVSTLPTVHGEDANIRLHPRGIRLMALANLGLSPRDQQSLLRMLAAPSGLILVTGPTGAGKTTTLYACLAHLNIGTRKINTIEDPVEFALPGVRQSQVNPAIGLGFPEMLRGVLRQGPDVIMVGEVRDPETATTAVRAANSGHLVLATLHAPVAAAAVQAMLSLGAHPHHLATSLTGVVAQRLVRVLNRDNRVEVAPDAYTGIFEDVLHHLGPDEGRRIYGPPPEAEQRGLAYTDRVGLFEVMSISPALRQMIFQEQPASAIRQKAHDEGMIGLRHAALLALARGITSLEEVFRVIPTEALLDES